MPSGLGNYIDLGGGWAQDPATGKVFLANPTKTPLGQAGGMPQVLNPGGSSSPVVTFSVPGPAGSPVSSGVFSSNVFGLPGILSGSVPFYLNAPLPSTIQALGQQGPFASFPSPFPGGLFLPRAGSEQGAGFIDRFGGPLGFAAAFGGLGALGTGGGLQGLPGAFGGMGSFGGLGGGAFGLPFGGIGAPAGSGFGLQLGGAPNLIPTPGGPLLGLPGGGVAPGSLSPAGGATQPGLRQPSGVGGERSAGGGGGAFTPVQIPANLAIGTAFASGDPNALAMAQRFIDPSGALQVQPQARTPEELAALAAQLQSSPDVRQFTLANGATGGQSSPLGASPSPAGPQSPQLVNMTPEEAARSGTQFFFQNGQQVFTNPGHVGNPFAGTGQPFYSTLPAGLTPEQLGPTAQALLSFGGLTPADVPLTLGVQPVGPPPGTAGTAVGRGDPGASGLPGAGVSDRIGLTDGGVTGGGGSFPPPPSTAGPFAPTPAGLGVNLLLNEIARREQLLNTSQVMQMQALQALLGSPVAPALNRVAADILSNPFPGSSEERRLAAQEAQTRRLGQASEGAVASVRQGLAEQGLRGGEAAGLTAGANFQRRAAIADAMEALDREFAALRVQERGAAAQTLGLTGQALREQTFEPSLDVASFFERRSVPEIGGLLQLLGQLEAANAAIQASQAQALPGVFTGIAGGLVQPTGITQQQILRLLGLA